MALLWLVAAAQGPDERRWSTDVTGTELFAGVAGELRGRPGGEELIGWGYIMRDNRKSTNSVWRILSNGQ